MNLMQLRETTLDPNTRRLVQLTIDDEDDQRTDAMMDMLLAKKRSEDRRNWLQEKATWQRLRSDNPPARRIKHSPVYKCIPGFLIKIPFSP